MSSKPKARATKKKQEKSAAPKVAARPKFVKPAAPAPRAFVSTRHGGEIISRNGRGFSDGEVEAAKIPLPLLADWKVPIDMRRRSVLEANIDALKGWFAAAKKVEPAEVEHEPASEPKKRAPRKKKQPAK